MTILLSILAFNLIIIVHELGHFIVAKLCKIKVHEFSLFFGPKIFSFNIGETMYSLRMIPVLAYVKLEGEDEPSEGERSYSQKPILTRMAVIAAGPIANVLMATVILLIIYSIAGFDTAKLDYVAKDSPAYNAGMKTGDVLVSYDHKKVYQQMDAMLFLVASKGKETDVVISRNGETKNLTIKPFVVPENKYLLGFRAKAAYGSESTVVEELIKDEPAQKAGLEIGDKIVAINKIPTKDMQDIMNNLTESKGSEVVLTVSRNTGEVEFKIKPKQGVNRQAYDLGLGFIGNVKGNMLEVIQHSIFDTYAYTRNIVYQLGFLFQGKFSFGDMSGPVGIVAAINGVVQMEQTALDQTLTLLRMMVFISIALGISNLLPIPPADGSKLVLLTVEGVRRKPLSVEKESLIMMAGFVFMMLLFVVIFFNDIYKLFTGTMW